MNDALRKPVKEMEIREALAQMGGLKASDPDGFRGVFFQHFWEIISSEVMWMAVECLIGGACPNLINSMHIVLIPKVPHPEFVNQFRLISLCNYSYKDNIILAHEVFHFLKLRKAKHRFELGIKLDMNKTYDRVE
ncbi:hypothetical protein ACFX10_035099 [Malus domestica]